MKATIDGITVEGTPREIDQLIRLREKKDDPKKKYDPFDTDITGKPWQLPWAISPFDGKVYIGKGTGESWFY